MPKPSGGRAAVLPSPATGGRMFSAPGFVAALTRTDGAMLVAGSMIGAGIFVVSADIARSVSSPFWLLMAWVLTGAMTMAGALSLAELAAVLPRAGGRYVFLEQSMGPAMGLLFRWTLFVVIQTRTIAAGAVAFGPLPDSLFPRTAWLGVTVAARGVKETTRNLPRALLRGTGRVTLQYVICNMARLPVLPGRPVQLLARRNQSIVA
ncbi:MAG: amino acid permease [Gemmatimonadaceae bacterium]|nr:amino acid permease [Gemmatimonadaceae bacterium]